MSENDLYAAFATVNNNGRNTGGLDQLDQANYLGMRIRSLTNVNPYMAQRPDALLSMASSPLSTMDLVNNGAAMYGMQTSDTFRNQLASMTPALQRSVWSGLTAAQQMTLQQQGFKPAQRDEDAWYEGITNAIGSAGHMALNAVPTALQAVGADKVLDGMIWLGDQPAHMYRAIRMMDPEAQWLALGAAALGGAALAAFALPATGLSLVAGAGSLQAIGTIGTGALIAGTAAAAATNPGDWYHAWSTSAHGERTFDIASQQRADEILGDPRLINVARDVAFQLPQGYSIKALAREMAGNREVSIQSQVSRLGEVAKKFAAEGTAQYQQVFNGLLELIQAPQFQEAVQTLQRGKISLGRDVADNLGIIGVNQGSRAYNLISGAVDATMIFALDPLLIGGRAMKVYEFSRFGLSTATGEATWDNFMRIYNKEASVQKAHAKIAEAIETGNYELMRRFAPTMKERWLSLGAYRDELIGRGVIDGVTTKFEAKHFHEWLHYQNDLTPLMQGFGTVRGLNNGVVLARISARNEAWQAVAGRMRSFTNGLTDAKTEKYLLDTIAEMSDKKVMGMFPELLFDDISKAEHAVLLNEARDTRKLFNEAWDALDETTQAQRTYGAQLQGIAPKDTLGRMTVGNGTESLTWSEFVERERMLTGSADALTPHAGLLDGLGENWREQITGSLFHDYVMRTDRYAYSRLAGRALGHVPGASSMGELLTKMSTMTPPGTVLSLNGFDAPEQLRNFTRLGGLAGMPEWLQRDWGNLILNQPTTGIRMSALMSFVDNMLTIGGIDTMAEGVAIREKYLSRIFQSYGGGGIDQIIDTTGMQTKTSMFLSEMADAVVMPNLTELRKATKAGFIAHAIGIADLPVIEQFQTKVWKPSVLLRFGFIPRAAGEEFLNYMLRGGMGSLGQEMGAMSIARLRRFEALKAGEELGIYSSAAGDVKLLAEGAMPAGMRWVSRMLDRYDWGSPLNKMLNDYGHFYRELLEQGFGAEAAVDNVLAKMAGTEGLTLNRLADNAGDLERIASRQADLPMMAKARLNMTRAVDSVVLGNEYSWRRMAAGGVHDDMIDAANQWFEHHGSVMMRSVGSTNAGPYDPGASRQDHIKVRVEDNAKGQPQFMEFQTLRGQRTLKLNGDPAYENAMHHQMVRPIEDKLANTVAVPHYARVKPQDLDEQIVHQALTAYRSVNDFNARRIIDQLMYEPNWNSWQALLERFERTDPALAKALSLRIGREDLSIEAVTQAVFDAAVAGGMNVGLDNLNRELRRFQAGLDVLNTVPEEHRAFLAQWMQRYGNDDMVARSVEMEAMGIGIDSPRPARVLYRGMNSPNQVEVYVGQDGKRYLRLHAQPQGHWGDTGALSMTENIDQARNYANGQEEAAIIVHLDRDEIERQLGRAHGWDEVDWEPGGYPSGEGSEARGLYPFGENGEINAKLDQKRITLVDDSDEALEQVVTDARSMDMYWRPLGYTAKADAYDTAAVKLQTAINTYPAGSPERAEAVLAIVNENATQFMYDDVITGANTGDAFGISMDAMPYIDLPEGTWMVESNVFRDPHAEEVMALNQRERVLNEQRDAIRLEVAREMTGNPGFELDDISALAWNTSLDDLDLYRRINRAARERSAENLEELDTLVAQRQALERESAKLDLSARPIDLEYATPVRTSMDAFRTELQTLTDDELEHALMTGETPAGFKHVAATLNHTMFHPGDESVWGLSRHELPWTKRYVNTPDGTVLDVDGHHTMHAGNGVLHELMQRKGMNRDEFIEYFSERMAADAVTRYSRNELDALIGELVPATDEELQWMVRDALRLQLKRTFVIESPSWGNVDAPLYAPWNVVDHMRQVAVSGTSWGQMRPTSHFYNSWDDATEAARGDLIYALSDPEYATGFGHVQGARAGAGQFTEWGESPMMHDNMATLWVPVVSPSLMPQQAWDVETLAVRSNAPDVIRAHGEEVTAYLREMAAGRVGGFANRKLADAVASAWDEPAAYALDVPRTAFGAKGAHDFTSAYVSNDYSRVLSMDEEMLNEGGLGRFHPADIEIDQLRAAIADRMTMQMRQVWTGGNKQVLVPKTAASLADDGSMESVVQALDHMDNPAAVEVGTRFRAPEPVYDRGGNAVDFGDERFFDREFEYGEQGNVLWEAVAPMFMDGYDEVAGRAMWTTKRLPAEIGEQINDSREVIRAYRSKPTHLKKVGADLPNMVDSEVLQAFTPGKWDNFVRNAFDKVIGPSIDALARRPMAFHFFAQRYIQNKAMRDWLRDAYLVDKVQGIGLRVANINEQAAENAAQVANYARVIARETEVKNAMQWSDNTALAWLRGHDDLEHAINAAGTRLQDRIAVSGRGTKAGDDALVDMLSVSKARRRGVDELRNTLPMEMRDTDFLAYVRSQVRPHTMLESDFMEMNKTIIANHPVLSRLDDEEWGLIVRGERNLQNITREAGEMASVAAINDMLPFIDSHEFKTQFAEYGKGFLPFWYAEENFMKRWARTIALEPASIRKLQLTYMGLKSAGVVRSDPNGRDWFVYPGSGLLQEAVNKIPGLPDLPVGVMFQSPTDMMLPGMNSRFGVPQMGPLVSIPLDLLTVPMPELATMERQLLGDVAASKSALEQVIPSPLKATWDLINSDGSESRYASAQLSAIAQLEAEGKWLADDATPGQIDDALEMVRNHARVIMFAQALGGWFTPGPNTQLNTGDESSVSSIGIEDPAAILNSMYQNLIRELGIEDGTAQYLKLVPLTDLGEIVNPLAYTVSKNASVSGAPLPATEGALAFFDANSDYMSEFPNAGPWLLPMDPNATNASSQYAYNAQTLTGLRRRRTSEEFLQQIKFKKASGRYFDTRTQYLDEVERARTDGNSARVRQLNTAWDVWSGNYRAAHPVFKQMLESSDARQRRQTTISEMRTITRDPLAPQAPHSPVLTQMITDYDMYLTAKADLSLDRSIMGRAKVESLKARFEQRMNDIVLTNPAVQSFWTGVLRPESALD